jgi:peptidoglycan/LPS O-acetylase OafA/YrhL
MAFYGSEPDAYNLLMHLTFLSAWDARVTASILGVEWTIPIEMFWYAVLPLMLPVTADTRKRWALFLGLLLLAGLTKAVDLTGLPKHSAHFLPLSYGAYFYLGALAETWRARAGDLPERRRQYLTWGAIALFCFAMITDTGFSAAFLGLATAGLIAFRRDANSHRGFLCLRPVLFLGSISYSLYLIHPLAIELVAVLPALAQFSGFAHFLVVLMVTTTLSVVTYSPIEYPTNRLGRRLFGPTRTPDSPVQRA